MMEIVIVLSFGSARSEGWFIIDLLTAISRPGRLLYKSLMFRRMRTLASFKSGWVQHTNGWDQLGSTALKKLALGLA